MKILSSRLFWGLVLIFGGVLLLLDTFGIFKGGTLFWMIVLAIVGLLFISVYITNRIHWWALIPGIIFLTLAITMGLSTYLPGFRQANLDGPVLLGGIALSFLLVYLVERANWWAIIPTGVMATLAIVALLSSNAPGNIGGGIFFIGLGITFACVAILPTSTRQMQWAWIPAGILGLMGIVILMTAENLINYIWPSALILLGVILIGRSLRKL